MSVISKDIAASSLISKVRIVESAGGCGDCSRANAGSPISGKRVRSAARTPAQKRVGSSSCSSKENQATWPVLWRAQAASSVVFPKPAEAESNVRGSERLWLRRSIKCSRGSRMARTGGGVNLVTGKCGSGMIERPFSSAVRQTPPVSCTKDSFCGSLWKSQHCFTKRTILTQLNFSGLSKDQSFSCFFHHLFGHRLQTVDFQNTLDLHQQPVNDAKVASCNPHNSCQSFSIRKIIHADMHAQVTPALLEQPPGFFLGEHTKLMCKPHPGIQLRVARQTLF